MPKVMVAADLITLSAGQTRVRPFVLPPLAYAPAGYAGEFAGTVSVWPETALA
jgi:hypothetical protein